MSTDRARLHDALHHVAHLLPAQGPIAVFVHHNTLHAFQHLPFHEALEAASLLFDTRGYLSEARFFQEFQRGRITDADLDRALTLRHPGSHDAPAGIENPMWVERRVMTHPIPEESVQTLSWRVQETHATRRLRADLTPDERNALIDAGRATIERWLGEVQSGTLDARALWARMTGVEEAAEEAFASQFEIPATVSALRARLKKSPEAVVSAAMWGACGVVRARSADDDRDLLDRVGRDRTLRDLVLACTGEDSRERVDSVMIPLCAAFLDQGVAHWRAPERTLGLYRVWRHSLLDARGPEPSWRMGLREKVQRDEAADLDAWGSIAESLDAMGVSEEHYETYLARTALELPGWAGMFARLEAQPEERGAEPIEVTLADFLAVRLVLKRFAVEDTARRALGYTGRLSGLVDFVRRHHKLAIPRRSPLERRWKLFQLAQVIGLDLGALVSKSRDALEEIVARAEAFSEVERQRTWHDAYERHHHREVLSGIVANLQRPIERRRVSAPRLQAIFCIDDREESFRRHFEEQSDTNETLSVAGFFGLAIEFRGIDQGATAPLCPVVAKPTHVVIEVPLEEDEGASAARRRRRGFGARIWHHVGRATRSMLGGLVLSSTLGALSLPGMLLQVMAPRSWARVSGSLRTALLPTPRTALKVKERTAVATSDFNDQTQADRVQATLENIGLTRNFGRIVAVLGHGSSSVNNPHRSAYDCGACGGRDGGPNARLFAEIVNRPSVREILRGRGIEIPDTTWFVGGLHDTASDAVTLHDAEKVPEALRADFDAMERCLKVARMHSAQERCRRFAVAPRAPTLDAALRHVEARTADPSEARPELGHVTNAVCVVGRRSLTRGLFLDRRAFLVSYDPTIDKTGSILERILMAVGPVGAGINLEYYFSCVDNARFGSGTKLPHNLVSLLGVMDGTLSDLRTGLPKQMIEIHEPVRLLLVVEASTRALLVLCEKQPSLRELIANAWVRLVSIDPETQRVCTFADGTFVEDNGLTLSVPRVARSADWFRGHRDFLGPALIDPTERPRAA